MPGRPSRPILPRLRLTFRAWSQSGRKRLMCVGADTLQTMVEEGTISVLGGGEDDNLDLSKAAEDASLIRFVNQVLTEALELRPADFHVEPFENQLRVRYRVDGNLVEANTPAEVRRYQAAIVSRIKILS